MPPMPMPPMPILPMPILAVPRRGHRLLVAVCFIACLVGRNDSDQPVLSEIPAPIGPDLVQRRHWPHGLGVSRAWFGSLYVRSD